MSTLEFIAAIKWPATMLLLASMVTVLLKKNPETRKAWGTWFNRRNLRVNIGGQEIEASLAETRDSIDAAASPDPEVADPATQAANPNGEQQPSAQVRRDRSVENVRREAVATLAQNATRLGWLWARGERGASEPITAVHWDTAGNPSVRVIAKEDIASELQRIIDQQKIRLSAEEIERLRAEIQRRGWDRAPAGQSTEDDEQPNTA